MKLIDYLALRAFAREALGDQLQGRPDALADVGRSGELLVSGLPAKASSAAAMLYNLAHLTYCTDAGAATAADVAGFSSKVQRHAEALAAHLPERQAAELLRTLAEALNAEAAPEAPPEAPREPADWAPVAQEMARAIIKRQSARDLYPSQDVIADEVAEALRKRGVHGPNGPLSAATIKRHAFKGITSADKRTLSTLNRQGK